jgi:hypothetical protein
MRTTNNTMEMHANMDNRRGWQTTTLNANRDEYDEQGQT